MKLALVIVTVLISLSGYSAELKTCKWNENMRQFVVPNSDTIELLRDALQEKNSRQDKIKLIEDIIAMEERYSTVETPSVCDLVSKTYKVSTEKCKKTFGTNAFLYLMDGTPKNAKDANLTCAIGLNIRLLFY